MVRNIILIICDTLRQDYCKCYGGCAHTPNVDMLAKEGVMFTHFLPASFPTGPFRKDIRQEDLHLPITPGEEDGRKKTI